MAEEPEPVPRIDELLSEALAVAEGAGPEALERFYAAHPEHAEELRRRVEVLARCGFLAAASEDGDDDEDAAKPPRRLGDFRLLKRIGEGGMGVVYLAEQISLPRRVALKVVRPDQLFFGASRARFHREITTIASLNHPGIVPIYAVGEDDGVPYYAMEEIAGASLADLLARAAELPPSERTGAALGRLAREARPDLAESREPGAGWLFDGTWCEVACRIVLQLANALSHAHQRGVLHRDLKPSNVMITGTGRVVLLDFGLASSASAEGITRSGALLGSLPYMSPEQVRGDADAIDAASDVYSLGATLYELITLRPPFGRGEAPSLMEAIARGTPVPPRALNPEIPRDVETVCLSAMAADRRHRYTSAADLARDLDNVLTHRPIEARRAGPAERFWRFMQRHPTASVAAGAVVLLLVLLPTVLLIQEVRAGRRIETLLDAESDARRDAQEQRDRALANFGYARDAMDTFLKRIGGERLEDVPEMQALQRDFLTEALEFYRRLIREGSADPSLHRDVAYLEKRLVEVQLLLGKEEEGEVEARRSVAALEARLHDSPGDAGLRADLATAHASLGLAELGRHDLEASERSFRRAIELHRSVVAARADDGTGERFLANSIGVLGHVLTRLGRGDEAVATCKEGVAILSRLIERFPGEQSSRFELARVLLNLATALRHQHRGEEVVAALRRAESLLGALVAADPRDMDHRSYHAAALNHLGRWQLRCGEAEEAERTLLAALEARRRLAKDFPDVQGFRWDLAESRRLLGAAQLHLGLIDEARNELEQAEVAYRALVQESPEHIGFRSEWAAARSCLAELSLAEQRPGLALFLADGAIEEQHRCLRVTPSDPDCLGFMVRHHCARAAALAALGDRDQALATLRAALETSGPGRWELPAIASACARALECADDSADPRPEAPEPYAHEVTSLAIDALERLKQVDDTALQRFLESESCDRLSDREEFRDWEE